MKKGNLFANCVFAVFFLSLVLSFTSCSTDSSNDVDTIVTETIEKSESPFSIVLKAKNSEGVDITTKGDVNDVTLFVFDQQDNFVKQINISKSSLLNRSVIDIQCPNTEKITVIAWSGISPNNENISAMSQANIISDLEVSLKSNNGVATHPSDLFHGQTTINRNNTKTNSTNELVIARKTAIFNLTTKGLDDKNCEYYYKIKNSKGSLNYQGEISGDEVEYLIPANFDNKGNLVASSQTILPADQVVIELYKNGNLLFSNKNDQKNEILSAKAGKQLDITFKYAGDISTNVVITDWATIIQHVTIN